MERRKYTTKGVIDGINEKYKGSIIVPEGFEFRGSEVKEKFICIIHGEFESIPYKILHDKTKYGCQKCSPFGPKGWKYIKEKLRLKYGDLYDYSLNDIEYTTRQKLKIICRKHGMFEQSYSDHLSGCGCPICYKELKGITVNDFLYGSIEHHGDTYGYDYIFEDYKNSKSKVRIICPKHGIFIQHANDHRKGVGCPSCKTTSKGESKIKKFLSDNNIGFIPQKSFDECSLKRKLRYDFYVPDKRLLIEYDGIQHNTKVFKGKHRSNIEVNDTIKTEYAIKNGMRLLRISHTDDIIDTLNREFKGVF